MPSDVPQADSGDARVAPLSYRVFAQTSEVRADEFALVQKARTYFAAEIAFQERIYGEDGARYLIEITEAKRAPVMLRATTRRATELDWAVAARAEIAGRATGMGTLARRCQVLWTLEANEERALLTLSAMLAATYLGPVIPPDESTLFGVRGARERIERLDR